MKCYATPWRLWREEQKCGTMLQKILKVVIQFTLQKRISRKTALVHPFKFHQNSHHCFLIDKSLVLKRNKLLLILLLLLLLFDMCEHLCNSWCFKAKAGYKNVWALSFTQQKGGCGKSLFPQSILILNIRGLFEENPLMKNCVTPMERGRS